ncbi:MAG: FAD-containing oxidoreductase [Asticcacaulis sp.]|nr:FAD-containing oxidoreductase [Asticcacaulis sp.]
MTELFDAIVIGAGQAGPSLATRLAQQGRKVALIERERLGGTCVNNGCIPTKTLVASARAAHIVRRARDFGVIASEPQIDMKAVMARKNAVVQASRDSLAQWVGGTAGLEFIIGEARFSGPKTVHVGGRELSSPLIVINTGGRPVVPDWPGLEQVPYLTNIEMMDLDRLPAHLIVAGGSYIGLEFAQIFRRLGSEVSVVEYADRLIAREDAAVSEAVREVLAAEGINFHVRARDFAVEPDRNGVKLRLTSDNKPLIIEGSDLLLALGRRPNVEALGLDAAGIALDARGYIAVDDGLMTSAEGVFALGDVNGRGAFTHTSYNDYEILAANLDGDDRKLSDRVTAYALYTDPPLARTGMSDAAAAALGRPVLKAHMAMSRVGRARERGETQGFMEVLVDAERKTILGATLFGIEADEVIHIFIQAMALNIPYTELQKIVPVHPTVSELIPTLLDQLKPLRGIGS